MEDVEVEVEKDISEEFEGMISELADKYVEVG